MPFSASSPSLVLILVFCHPECDKIKGLAPASFPSPQPMYFVAMPTVYFETFGCQMNVSDSEMIASELGKFGYSAAQNPASADLLIVNTCSVREKAEQRAIARLNEFAGLKKKAKRKVALWVVGCMA